MERKEEKSNNGLWKAVSDSIVDVPGIGTAKGFGVICLALVVIAMIIAQNG